ncbi:MAG TPA: hypothetical protein VK400_20715 [Pyrinomonadaceae bacterium]|nr:hypothetical protein [Pyrinomonadaceae bacterium]
MSKVESADLILKLYDLRREEKMREARTWITSFFPESAADIMQVMINPETSGYFRMVVTYWDMAASFVNHGAIDEQMFLESGGECVIVFSKIEPHLEEVRRIMGSPNYLKNLETLVMKMPDAKEMLAARREMMKRWMQARTETSTTA